MYDLVKYLQNKLDEISEGSYTVSKERNIDTDFSNNDVIVSAMSATITNSQATDIPYEISIFTSDIDKVMTDFTVLAKTCSNVPITEIADGELVTIVPFFNTPVVMEKDISFGSQRMAKIVVFASVNELLGVNNIKTLKIDNEVIDKISASFNYSAEANSSRVSGQELAMSKKKAASSSVNFMALNKSSAFFNKAFKIATGSLSGNTAFSVNMELYNGLTATLSMFITSYSLNDERAKLDSVNITMLLYNGMGD